MFLNFILSFLGGSVVKNLPAMQDTWVQTLGRKDILEKEIGNPLQDSCLGNPMDRRVWWATVNDGIAESDKTW